MLSGCFGKAVEASAWGPSVVLEKCHVLLEALHSTGLLDAKQLFYCKAKVEVLLKLLRALERAPEIEGVLVQEVENRCLTVRLVSFEGLHGCTKSFTRATRLFWHCDCSLHVILTDCPNIEQAFSMNLGRSRQQAYQVKGRNCLYHLLC